MTDQLIEYLMRFVGTPYMWAGKNPIIGFDCSGLICEGLIAVGVLPFGTVMNAQELYDHFRNPKPAAEAVRGDLVFFGAGAKGVNHVGLCIGDGLMLEAGGGGPAVNNRAQASDHNAFVKVRPMHYRKDFFEVVGMTNALLIKTV